MTCTIVYLPASVLNKRTKCLQSEIGIALDLVTDQIRHDSNVIAEAATHFDSDRFASAVRAPYRTHQHQQ